ncbi:hypothetical protein SPADD19_01356 [Streptococcus parasanguinis]|nr:hypothetical protein SPADD19_01356 [Streptococcus parasanguinis]
MRKTNFQKTIHPATTLFIVGILSMLISILLRLGMTPLENSVYFTSLFDFLRLLHFISSSVSFLSLLLFLGLVGYEIKIRHREDRISNLFKSITQTFSLRLFLIQREHTESVSTSEQGNVKRYNPVNKQFNKAIQKAVVDIREGSASLIIPVPKSQQAIRILKDLETIISEEISSRNPDYYFSRPERKGMAFYFIGTRRN